jgi:hypothetical protein
MSFTMRCRWESYAACFAVFGKQTIDCSSCLSEVSRAAAFQRVESAPRRSVFKSSVRRLIENQDVTLMVEDFQRRVTELRFVEGIEKVEHVDYATGDEFWVRFNRPLDLKELRDIAGKHGAALVKFGGLPSKLPRPLAEILWDGVGHVITKKIGGWSKFTASLGFEPDGIAKIATDAHGPYQIFIATQEEGVQILYEYLGVEYVAPAKPVAPPPKAPTVAVAKTTPPAPKPPPATPAPVASKPQSSTQPAQTAPASTPQPIPASEPAPPKGQYRPHAWGQALTTSETKSASPKDEKKEQ